MERIAISKKETAEVDEKYRGLGLADYDAEQVIAAAEEALEEARVSLMMAFRFMDAALWHMPMATMPFNETVGTNGGALLFNPLKVIDRYCESPDELARDYLHAVMHCVYRQPFDRDHENAFAWTLACDVVAELSAMEMAYDKFPSSGDELRLYYERELEARVGKITPFKLYRLFTSIAPGMDANEEMGMSHALMQQLKAVFRRDGHQQWAVWRHENKQDKKTKDQGDPMKDEMEDAKKLKAKADGNQQSDGDAEADPSQQGEAESAESGSQQSGASLGNPDQGKDQEDENEDSGNDDDDGMSVTPNEDQAPDVANESLDVEGEDLPDTEDNGIDSTRPGQQSDGGKPSIDEEGDYPTEEEQDEWEKIGKEMEEDLRSISKSWGSKAGKLLTNLAVTNRKQCSYKDFLRRFCTMSEDMTINDDEFDYIFYTYGLKRYGNMPLVEPLEYTERNRVRDFVIAIDTSGSCSGELVKRFIECTYGIMRESESFGDTINVHLIQCDAAIQSDVVISSLDQLEQMKDDFEVCGHGGTDFRPVFEYVDKLIEDGDLKKLKGLIYFTDGMGTYPDHPPDYDAAFVFVDNDGMSWGVPPWAMRIVISDEELMTL